MLSSKQSSKFVLCYYSWREGEGNVPLPETVVAPAGSEGLHLPEIHIPRFHLYPILVSSQLEMSLKANEGKENNGKLGVDVRSK